MNESPMFMPRGRNIIFATALILSIVFLTIDLILPLGVAGGVLYVVVVVIGFWFRSLNQVIFITALCVVLTIIGYYFSPDGGIGWKVFFNRALAILAITSTAFVLYVTKKPTGGGEDSALKSQPALYETVNVTGYKGLFASFPVLLLVAGVSFWSSQKSDAEQIWVSHTLKVQSALVDVLLTLQNAETGQRGFLLTEDKKYLEPFTYANDRIGNVMKRVRQLTADNPDQQNRLDQIDPLIDKKLVELNETISLIKANKREASLQLVATDRGKETMDQIRSLIADMEIDERDLLEQRHVSYETSERIAKTLNLIGFTLLVLIGIFVSLRARSLLVLSARAEEGLRKVHSELEQRVDERTRELNFRKVALDEHAIVSITDVKGNITYVNEKFCSISGYSEDELIGQNHRMLKSDEHSPELYSDLWRTIANGQPWHGELRNIKKDGGNYWVNATIVPFLNEEGEPFQYIAIRTDVTTRKIAELEALKAKEEAQIANQAKSEFLSSMSHELRTPMNAILGFSQLLDNDPEQPLSEDQQDSLTHIRNSGRHLLELINEVLDLSKIEAGKMELSIEEVSLSAIIDEGLQSVLTGAEERGIDISVVDTVGQAPMVCADHVRFLQVLINLLSNAIKYNRENGKVTIGVEETAGDMLRIAVRDTGEGIPENRQDELFKPFSRLDAESSGIEGTGIGLVICKDLIERMGGVIGMESEIGKGSTFWFELPIAKSDLEAP